MKKKYNLKNLSWKPNPYLKLFGKNELLKTRTHQNMFSKNLDSTTGSIIKAFRTNFKITQKQMADTINITESNLSAIENDKREIGVDLATRIGAFLGVHPSILLFPKGEEALKAHQGIMKKAAKLKKLRNVA